MDYDIYIMLGRGAIGELAGSCSELESELPYGWHLTLSIFNCDNTSEVLAVFDSLCGQCQMPSLTSPGLLVFPEAVCLAITPVQELLNLHRQLETTLLKIGALVNQNYLSSSWIPHVTLFRGSDASRKQLVDQFSTLSRTYQLPVIGLQLITVSENRIRRTFSF